MAVVVNIKVEDMKVILICNCFSMLENEKEVYILVVAHLYAGEPVSAKIFEKLNHKLLANLAHHRLYINLPWCEKKNTSLEFAKNHDQDLNLIDSQRNYEGKSVLHPADRADDVLRAG